MARRQPGRREVAEARFDEPGYIATPPCLWGSPEHGFETPPLMNGVTIRVVAVTNTSEMALPEVTPAPREFRPYNNFSMSAAGHTRRR